MRKITRNKTMYRDNEVTINHTSFISSQVVDYIKRKGRTTGFFVLLLIMFAVFTGCNKGRSQESTKCPPVELIENTFAESQQEIKSVLNELFKSIQDKDADKLVSFHIYGPKFTEFKDSKKRVGAIENEQHERGLVGAISAFDYSLDDLKIDVFGNVSVVTFHADFRPTINGTIGQIRGGVTLVFVKVDNAWKITHEHFSPLI